MATYANLQDQYPLRGTLGRNKARDAREWLIEGVLVTAAAVSILTTLGILFSLATEAVSFFRDVSLAQYFGDTRWSPGGTRGRYGIWPLISATMMTSFIALCIAVPLGLLAAVYLSEFASHGARSVIKPALEVLAGVPTVVFGFFALIFVTPLLRDVIPGVSIFNALSAGLVMGIAILPLVSSLSEDAMSSVPRSLREGAYGLGATRFEVATKVVLPAALSGIVASIILALSRAVGETMIVALAAGQLPKLTIDPREQMQTMTSYIVQVTQGEASAGSVQYKTIFAVGTTLFVLTFLMNLFSFWFVRRFREVYD